MCEIQKTKEFAKQWIENGNPCMYRYGFAYKGASSRTITKEKALELLPSYSYGMVYRILYLLLVAYGTLWNIWST